MLLFGVVTMVSFALQDYHLHDLELPPVESMGDPVIFTYHSSLTLESYLRKDVKLV